MHKIKFKVLMCFGDNSMVESDALNSLFESLKNYYEVSSADSKRDISNDIINKSDSILSHDDVELSSLLTLFKINNSIRLTSHNDEDVLFGDLEEKLSSPADIRFLILLLVSSIAGDIYALSVCKDYVSNMLKQEKQASKTLVDLSLRYIVRWGQIEKVCKCFGKATLRDELLDTSNYFSYLISEYYGLTLPEIDRDDVVDLYTARYFAESMGERIVIKHIVQAKEAFKNGMISKDRFEKSLKKFEEGPKKNVSSDLLRLYREKRSSFNIDVSGPLAENIQDIQYEQKRYSHLDSRQQLEYQHAFSSEPVEEFINKYHQIRLNDLLVHLVSNYKYLNLGEISLEIKLLIQFSHDPEQLYSEFDYFLNYVLNLSKSNQESLMSLLSNLDDYAKEDTIK